MNPPFTGRTGKEITRENVRLVLSPTSYPDLVKNFGEQVREQELLETEVAQGESGLQLGRPA
jgi:hypothetical protein